MELLDIIDINGNPTGETVERGRAHHEGIMHRTSHVWLLRKHDGSLQVLLQKRCARKDSFPGCYDISSAGHIPAGCEFTESAIRELKEELGVTAAPEELVYCGDRTFAVDRSFHGEPFHDRQFSRVFYLKKDADESSFLLQEEEVESVLWMDFEACVTAVRENSIPHCIFLSELEMVQKAWEKA